MFLLFFLNRGKNLIARIFFRKKLFSHFQKGKITKGASSIRDAMKTEERVHSFRKINHITSPIIAFFP